jgi:hypothetical protein
MQWHKDDDYSSWKKIHRGIDNNMNSCGRKGLYSKNNNVTNRISIAIPYKTETISYSGLYCYDNQQKPGAISNQGRTIST